MKVSALAGAIFTAPIWLYQVWAFIVPGLLAKEKKWALIFIAAATPMFAGGVAVGYIVMPKGIMVLLSFTQNGVSNLQDVNAVPVVPDPHHGGLRSRLLDPADRADAEHRRCGQGQVTWRSTARS